MCESFWKANVRLSILILYSGTTAPVGAEFTPDDAVLLVLFLRSKRHMSDFH